MPKLISFLRIALLGAVLCVPLSGAASAETARFFTTLPDIPLMEGLEELSDQASIFDKPEGRIADVWAVGRGVTRAEVESYYRQSLPQFGWKPKGREGLLFHREGEELRLGVAQQSGRTSLHILLSPD